MDNPAISPQQNLYDLAVCQQSLTKSRRSSFNYALFSKTGIITNAASSLASKIRKVVNPSVNASDEALIEIQDLTKLITENNELWDDFRSKLVESNIITNTAVTFFLIRYISERRDDLDFMLKEFKKKKEEEPKKQSTGVVFIRRVRTSTESLSNLASKGIKNMKMRKSFELVLHRRGSGEEQIQNSTHVPTGSKDLKSPSSCQKCTNHPQEDVGKEHTSYSLPSLVPSGSQGTRRFSFNYRRRSQSNTSEENTKKAMIQQRISPSGAESSRPKRYAELPRKLIVDYDGTANGFTPEKVSTEFHSCAVLTGNEQWDTKHATSATFEARVTATSNRDTPQKPTMSSMLEPTLDVKRRASFVRMSDFNEKRSGVTPKGAFDLEV